MKRIFALLLCLVLLLGCFSGCSSKKEENASVPLYFNPDKALLVDLLQLDFLGLTLDGDTITGITRRSDMPYYRLARNSFVQIVGGNNVKLNSSKLFADNESGNLWLHDLAKVYIGEDGLGEDALIGISMSTPR